MEREDIKILVKKWWEIYEDETLDYNNDNSVNLQPFSSPLSEPDVIPLVSAPSAA